MARFPAEQLRLHGNSISYRRAGPAGGPTLLLLHGIAGSSRTWLDTMEHLSTQHDVIALDLPGHGKSDKPLGDYSLGAQASVVRDFMAVIGVDRATVIGHSYGGGVCLQLAYQFPANCERLVLVDSGGLGRDVTLMLRLLTLPGAEYVMPAVCPRFVAEGGNEVARFLGRIGWRNPRLVAGWQSYASLADPHARKAFVRTLRAVIEPGGQSVSAADRLYLAARLPTLIIWGERDAIIPPSHARAAHEAIDGSRLEIMKGCGHFPHVQQPEQFAGLVSDFVASTAAASMDVRELRTLILGGATSR